MMSSRRWKRSSAAALVAAVSLATLIAVVDRDQWVGWLAGEEAAGAAASGDLIYTCPMDPSVEAHAPSKCPLCGMDLTPVKRAERGAMLFLDPEAMRRAGMQLAAAETRTLRRRVIAFGTVAPAKIPELPRTVEAEIYGDDAAAIAHSTEVGAVAPALPVERFTGAITAIRDATEEAPARVRVDLVDPGALLRSGMTIELQIAVDLVDRVVVPASAIMYAGKRRLVFVDKGKGGLELRELTIGAQESGLVEVQTGLTAGERVAVSGTFLAGAESRIRSSNPLWEDRPTLAKPSKGKPEPPKRTAAGAAKPAGGVP